MVTNLYLVLIYFHITKNCDEILRRHVHRNKFFGIFSRKWPVCFDYATRNTNEWRRWNGKCQQMPNAKRQLCTWEKVNRIARRIYFVRPSRRCRIFKNKEMISHVSLSIRFSRLLWFFMRFLIEIIMIIANANVLLSFCGINSVKWHECDRISHSIAFEMREVSVVFLFPLRYILNELELQ